MSADVCSNEARSPGFPLIQKTGGTQTRLMTLKNAAAKDVEQKNLRNIANQQ